ncbi:MAG: Cro/C1-type DNA-binding domain [Bacteroidota bacterium]|jgi:DNA-binding Xre family transcriptional regulator|nr:Cro/C1-type DNA-binding domain [Bacteroidota bacterium]
MSINKAILKYLDEKGISHSVLVRKTGISKQNLSRILGSDDLKISQLNEICKALNLPVTYFFGVNEIDDHAKLTQRISELEEMLKDKKFRIKIYDKIEKERVYKWGNELIDEKFSYFSPEQRAYALKFISEDRIPKYSKRKYFDENQLVKYKEDLLIDLENFVEYEEEIRDLLDAQN